MTTTEPPTPDELLSRYLDGDLDPSERARVEHDPDLVMRLEQLRRARDAVAAPVVVPAAAREAALTAALEASGTSSQVRSIAVARQQRWYHSTKVIPFASAAAVVIALIMAVPFVISSSDDDDDAASESFDTAAGDATTQIETGALDDLDAAAVEEADAQAEATEAPEAAFAEPAEETVEELEPVAEAEAEEAPAADAATEESGDSGAASSPVDEEAEAVRLIPLLGDFSSPLSVVTELRSIGDDLIILPVDSETPCRAEASAEVENATIGAVGVVTIDLAEGATEAVVFSIGEDLVLFETANCTRL